MKRQITAWLGVAVFVAGALVGCQSTGRPDGAGGSPGAAAADARLDWWREARFGLFIHWGLYAIPAGKWGEETGYGEWIRHSAQIPIEEYDKLVGRFNPVKFDADEWCQMAKDAGMKYIVITSKHHDGFALFDSAVSDYDVMATPFQRDILKELSDACERHGLRMCFYHSIMDWHHPDYLPRRGWEVADRPAGDADFSRYVEYLRAQTTELLTGYGDIGIMWYDGQWEPTWTHEYGQALYDLCRNLQPDVIVNDRVDLGRQGHSGRVAEGYAGDYATPEQAVPAEGLPGVDWETCMTMNRHWGWNAADDQWKSSRDLIRTLVDVASKNGNYLLNVGPKADGTFPERAVERLAAMGDWMDVNGESIYGTTASPFGPLAWGRCTQKPRGEDTTLYLHVFDWPEDGRVVVPGIGNEVQRAFLLSDRDRTLRVTRRETDLQIGVPREAPDESCSVIALEVKGKPIIYRPPTIEAPADLLVDRLDVRVDTGSPDLEARFTLDGSDPTADSPICRGPIQLTDTAEVRVRSFHNGEAVSPVTSRLFRRVKPLPPASVGLVSNGLRLQTYSGDWNALPRFEELTPESASVVEMIGLAPQPSREYVGKVFAGYIRIPQQGVYRFELGSDDGSRLMIDRRPVVDNDGLHSYEVKDGVIPLAAGAHAIRIEWFNKTGGAVLDVKFGEVGSAPIPIPAAALFHAD